ncbi:MAG: hypothetical protein O2973_12790 [Gemmatimonadetes bacterium]|nr:hypothetical protein [Gemmatimonadota bacterium]
MKKFAVAVLFGMLQAAIHLFQLRSEDAHLLSKLGEHSLLERGRDVVGGPVPDAAVALDANASEKTEALELTRSNTHRSLAEAEFGRQVIETSRFLGEKEVDEHFALYSTQSQVLCCTPTDLNKSHAAFINLVGSGNVHKTCAYSRRRDDFVNS